METITCAVLVYVPILAVMVAVPFVALALDVNVIEVEPPLSVVEVEEMAPIDVLLLLQVTVVPSGSNVPPLVTFNVTVTLVLAAEMVWLLGLIATVGTVTA